MLSTSSSTGERVLVRLADGLEERLDEVDRSSAFSSSSSRGCFNNKRASGLRQTATTPERLSHSPTAGELVPSEPFKASGIGEEPRRDEGGRGELGSPRPGRGELLPFINIPM